MRKLIQIQFEVEDDDEVPADEYLNESLQYMLDVSDEEGRIRNFKFVGEGAMP